MMLGCTIKRCPSAAAPARPALDTAHSQTTTRGAYALAFAKELQVASPVSGMSPAGSLGHFEPVPTQTIQRVHLDLPGVASDPSRLCASCYKSLPTAESQRCSPLTPTTSTPHCRLIHRVQDRANQECLNTCAWLLAWACFAISHAASLTVPFACTAGTFSGK